MARIYKYPFEISDTVNVAVPVSYKIVHIGIDSSGDACLWAEVDPTETRQLQTIEFYIRGTGHELPSNSVHYTSFVQGPFVWHVYLPAEKREH